MLNLALLISRSERPEDYQRWKWALRERTALGTCGHEPPELFESADPVDELKADTDGLCGRPGSSGAGSRHGKSPGQPAAMPSGHPDTGRIRATSRSTAPDRAPPGASMNSDFDLHRKRIGVALDAQHRAFGRAPADKTRTETV